MKEQDDFICYPNTGVFWKLDQRKQYLLLKNLIQYLPTFSKFLSMPSFSIPHSPPPLGGTFVRSEEVLQMSHRWNVGALVRPQLPNPTQIYISNSWWKQ